MAGITRLLPNIVSIVAVVITIMPGMTMAGSVVDTSDHLSQESSSPYHVALVMCVWKRRHLTELVLRHYSQVANRLRESSSFPERSGEIFLDIVVAGSEGDESKLMAEKYGAHYVEVPNNPLGAKHNAALRTAAENIKDLDAVVVIGSDDLLNDEYFRILKSKFFPSTDKSDPGDSHEKNSSISLRMHILGLKDIFFLDVKSMRLVYTSGYRSYENPLAGSVGLGRAYSAEFLRLLEWKLWDDELNSRLDRSAATRAMTRLPVASKYMYLFNGRDHGVYAIDVKTSGFAADVGTNIWSFESIVSAASGKDARLLPFEDQNLTLVMQQGYSMDMFSALEHLRDTMTQQQSQRLADRENQEL